MTRKAFMYRLIGVVALVVFACLLFVAWGVDKLLARDESQRPAPKADASPFDGQRAYRDLEAIVGMGARVAGTEGIEKLRAMIRRELQAAGLEVREYAFEAATPLGARPMVDLIGVVEGTKPGIIVLGNHYDTKYLPDIDFVGANDGGSSTAWMLEMARVLGPQRDGRTLWLCFFDGEEAFGQWSAVDGLYGSRALVEKLKADGELADVKAMVNVDMIGDCYLAIYKDVAAPAWLTRTVWDTAESLGYAQHFVLFSHGIDDDHAPFRRAGVPALNVIDFRYGGSALDHRRNWHTSKDRLDMVCAESLQVVGDVIYHALAGIDDALDERGQDSND